MKLKIDLKKGFTGCLTNVIVWLPLIAAVIPGDELRLVITRGSFDTASGIPGHERKVAYDFSVRHCAAGDVVRALGLLSLAFRKVLLVGLSGTAPHIHAEQPRMYDDVLRNVRAVASFIDRAR